MEKDEGVVEQAVLIRIRGLMEQFGSEAERAAIDVLMQDLQDTVNASGQGEVDGDEYGNHECIIYVYGPDAELLVDRVVAAVRRSPFISRANVIIRLGEPGALERSIDL